MRIEKIKRDIRNKEINEWVFLNGVPHMNFSKFELDVFRLIEKEGFVIRGRLREDMEPKLIVELDRNADVKNIEYKENS